MLKKRLIFALYFYNRNFCLSRNFDLQKVGAIDWIWENYDFDSIIKSIDELMILNVGRGPIHEFAQFLGPLLSECLMPVTLGGGIASVADAAQLFETGADKVTLNRAIFEDPALVEGIVGRYGAQSVVASIDYRENQNRVVYINSGKTKVDLAWTEIPKRLNDLGCGEILLNSIDRDGNGVGYDVGAAQSFSYAIDCPIIVSGGGETSTHLGDGLREVSIDGVVTGSLFNFMCDGLRSARMQVRACGVDLAQW